MSAPFRIVILALSLFCCQAFSKEKTSSIESETIIGSSSTDETFSVDGDLSTSPAEVREKFPWGISFSKNNSKSTDPTGAAIEDVTNSFQTSLGFESKGHFEVGGGYSYSVTPNENLTSLGPNLYIGYIFEEKTSVKTTSSKKKSNEDDSADEEDFKRSIGFKLTATTDHYVEAFTVAQPPLTRGGRPRPTTGVNEITQTNLLFEVPIKAAEWISLRPSAAFYKYSTDVATFLNFINSKRLAFGTVGLQGSAASLAKFEAALQVTFYAFDSWELMMDESYSTLAADDSNSWSSKAEIFDNLGPWRLGIGYSNLSSVPANDNAVIFNVAYDF